MVCKYQKTNTATSRRSGRNVVPDPRTEKYNAPTMRETLRKWWPLLKAALVVAILVGIGRVFVRDLGKAELWRRPIHFDWLVVSGILYLLGIGFSALFWYRLLRSLGQQPTAATAVRAYYIGHLGKYVPGKAWALLLRTTLAHGPGVRLGVAGLTTGYEVLTTMAAGVLLAALLFAAQVQNYFAPFDWSELPRLFDLFRLELPDASGLDRRLPVLVALLLFVPLALPVLPVVNNLLVRRIMSRFRDADAAPLPSVHLVSFVEGLALTAVGWLFLGASLWAVLQAVLGAPPPDWDSLSFCAASLALAYVAGFVIPIPGGLGVREFFLAMFLVPVLPARSAEEARAVAILVAGVLRLVWTAAEVITAAGVYWLPKPAVAPAGGTP